MSIVKGESMAARMAGQRGYTPLSTNIVPGLRVKRQWEVYCEGAEESENGWQGMPMHLTLKFKGMTPS